jgi:hypothetical protein
MSSGQSRRLGYALAAGAAYDGVFAVAILGFTQPAAAILRIDLPADPVYLYLCGVLLFILAAVYAAAALDPGRYVAVAPVSAAGRGAGFALFFWAWLGGRPPAFLAMGLADLAIGVVTIMLWRRAATLSD